MSPLWRDRIRIALSPQQVTIVRYSRGWSARLRDKRIISCATPSNNDSSWQLALHGLTTVLPEFNTRRSDVTVILSNHFVRYALVPYSVQISSGAEELALVRHRFTQIYGDAAAPWALRLSDGGGEPQRVASAVDQGLIEALNALFTAGKLRLGSIQPYLMVAFNQWRKQLGRSAWFALVEPGRLCLALLQDHHWRVLKTMKISVHWQTELLTLLERERLLLGITADNDQQPIPVYIHAPGQDGFDSVQQPPPGFQVLQLPRTPANMEHNDACYAMALAG
ncbi:MAG: hypothetical protein HY080_14920 [Gammaproteobacteria bacterium]|nr:hypothetical protein [Gammaproteobacteria bacterium]